MILLSVLAVTLVHAQTVGNYTLRKQLLAPGAQAVAPDTRLIHTLAEPGAGLYMGGPYRLTGGFQTPRRAQLPDELLIDGFE